VFLVPIRCLVCALLPRLLFTRLWTKTATVFTSRLLLRTGFILACTELLQIFPESCYIASVPTAQKTLLYYWLAPTAQKTSHAAAIGVWRLTAADIYLLVCCVATSEAGRGVATLSTVMCITQQRAINTCTFIVACGFLGFYASTALAWDKQTTIYIASLNPITVTSFELSMLCCSWHQWVETLAYNEVRYLNDFPIKPRLEQMSVFTFYCI
jgi:hypothetical protein